MAARRALGRARRREARPHPDRDRRYAFQAVVAAARSTLYPPTRLTLGCPGNPPGRWCTTGRGGSTWESVTGRNRGSERAETGPREVPFPGEGSAGTAKRTCCRAKRGIARRGSHRVARSSGAAERGGEAAGRALPAVGQGERGPGGPPIRCQPGLFILPPGGHLIHQTAGHSPG